MICNVSHFDCAFWLATPRTPPLWQHGFYLVNRLVLRRFLTSARSGVVKPSVARLRQHDAPISLTNQPSLDARVDGILCCLSRNRISQLRLSQHCVVHEICFQHVAFVCLHMVGRSLGCGSPHACLLSPKRSSLCLDLLCVFICGNGHQLSLAPWSTLTGLRRTTWFLRKGHSPLESL